VRFHRHGRAGDGSPTIGVVIPCRDNAWALDGVLAALVRQSSPPDAIVVIDDASKPEQEARIRALCRRYAATYRRLAALRDDRERLGRRSHARNAGTRALATDVVLYLDGDMLPGPRYVEAIRQRHAAWPRCYLRGQRYSIPLALQSRGMDACLRLIRTRLAATRVDPGYAIGGPSADRVDRSAYRDRWEWCAGNNLSVRVVHVARIGGWDERFFGWGEEDIDFSYRLHRSGLAPIFVADAHAYHLDHPVDDASNASSLVANARYLVNKFPAVVEHRRSAYALYGIDVDGLTR
jgi:GT2 family glycosyltransferase